MYVKRSGVQRLALQIMYDLATRVPQVLLHRVEDCYPTVKEKLAELMQEPETGDKLEYGIHEIGMTDKEEKVYKECNAVVAIDSVVDTNSKVPDNISYPDAVKMMIKEEIIDDDDDDWYCIDGNVAMKLEIKEEITLEDHNIYVDESVIGEDNLISSDKITLSDMCDQYLRDTLVEDNDDRVRLDTEVEITKNWSISDHSQDTLPAFDITKIKREKDDEVIMRAQRYSTFMSMSPKSSSVKVRKGYMVKFPSNMVRTLKKKKKECRVCKRRFSDELKLAEHMNIHAVSFTCIVCGEAFPCNGALKGHIRVHIGERPYHCKGCLKSKSRCNLTKSKCNT